MADKLDSFVFSSSPEVRGKHNLSRLAELAAEFSSLTKTITRSSEEEKIAKSQREKIEDQLIEEMANEGLQNFRLADGMNLYRRTDKFYGPAEGVDKQELIKELAAHPQTMDLVELNFNSNSLRSRMKEIEANGEEIPQELEAKLKVIEKFRIGYRS